MQHRFKIGTRGLIMELSYLKDFAKLGTKGQEILLWILEKAVCFPNIENGLFVEELSSQSGYTESLLRNHLPRLVELGLISCEKVKIEGIIRPKNKYFVPRNLVMSLKNLATIEIQSKNQTFPEIQEYNKQHEPTIEENTWKKVDPDVTFREPR